MLEKTMSPFQNKLKLLMHKYVKYTYKITKQFPKEEQYSSANQLRRSALSVVLNFIEGYCRRKLKVRLNFYEISYGSLGESRYIYYLALDEKWIKKEEYDHVISLANEIGAMLWSEIESTENSIKKSGKVVK